MADCDLCESDVFDFDDTELNLLLADAMSRMDRNEPVDVEAMIAANPEYALEIGSFFSLSQELGAMLGAIPPSEPKRSTVEEANRSTASFDGITIPMLRDLPVDDSPDPKQIGKYEVRRRLGGGEFGRVFLAFDPLAQREVAIKVPVRKERISNDQRRAFLHEAQSAASLRHEHIATLYDVVVDEATNKVSLVYEYIHGPSLYQALKEQKPDRAEAIGWIADIADALHYAHRRDIVHRDIKPSNIMLAECDGRLQPRIVDFGLALLRNQSWRNSEGHVVGAFAYMSPEQARGDSHWATAQADIFSLGVVLYEILSGKSPWEGSSGSAILRDICKRHPTPLRVLDDSVPRELERVCLKAMAKSPEDRYTTAGDMARDLRAAMAAKTRKPVRWMAASAAMALLVVGAAGWQLLSQGNRLVAAPPVAPTPATIETIPVQEVRLEVRVQLDGKPGRYRVLDGQTVELESGDGVQIYADTKSPGYLYTLWFRPDGQVKLLGGSDLENARPAIQEPPVGSELAWDTFGPSCVGDNFIVAFTKATPLTEQELKALESASWKTEANRLGEMAMLEFGYPRSPSNLAGVTRGGDATNGSTSVEQDVYLGQLGSILKDKWNCYYQAFLFRVHESGFRQQGN